MQQYLLSRELRCCKNNFTTIVGQLTENKILHCCENLAEGTFAAGDSTVYILAMGQTFAESKIRRRILVFGTGKYLPYSAKIQQRFSKNAGWTD